MKKTLSKILLGLLMGLARGILRKYRVKTVGITGAAGKTSTKEAVHAMLATQYSTARTWNTLNSPWAVVASIIHPGIELPINSVEEAVLSPLRALILIGEGLWKNLFSVRYPGVFVLELSEDYTGVMKDFAKFIKLDVAVITNLGAAHTEFFKSLEDMKDEQFEITTLLKPQGLLVASLVNDGITPYLANYNGRVLTYGFDEAAGVRAKVSSSADLQVSYQVEIDDDKAFELTLPWGRHRMLAILAAVAVGREFGMISPQIAEVAQRMDVEVYRRFKATTTERGIVLIDDTYNANIESMKLALDSLNDLKEGRRVAILGGMRELGQLHNASHNIVGKYAVGKVDILILVGDESVLFANGAKSVNFPDSQIFQISWNPDNPDISSATRAVLEILKSGDKVLVKASRGVGLIRLFNSLLQELNNGRNNLTE